MKTLSRFFIKHLTFSGLYGKIYTITRRGSLVLKNRRKTLYNITLTALFFAIGLVLPFFTAQIKQIGSMLLPMHLPVMLCGLVCSWRYGASLGALLPITRSFMFGMPTIYPHALSMSIECAVYGFVIGFMFERFRRKNIPSVYISLICAMIVGRIVKGAFTALLLGVAGNAYTLSMFISGTFLNAIPGIILQLILIPAVMIVLDRARLIRFNKISEEQGENK